MANESYLFGNDSWGGWGPRYFFSFYTELGGRGPGAVLEAASLVTIVIASVIANGTIAAAILRYREMRTVTNAFLLNLAVADLVFALGAPLVVTARLTDQWTLGEGMCRLLPYSQFVCGSVLLWTLTLISMDRYRCIVVPPYRSRLTPCRAALLVTATWALASLLLLPLAFWFRPQLVEPGITICTLVFPRSDTVPVSLLFTLPAVFFSGVLPMALLVYYYQHIFRKLLSSRNRWIVPCAVVAAQSPQAVAQIRRDSELSFSGIVGFNKTLRKLSVTSRLSVSLTAHEELRLGRHLRVVRVLLLNVVLVLLMWLPITTVMLLIYIDGSRPTEAPVSDYFLHSCHFVWALIIALLNTVVNPLLYGVLSENFRQCLARMWRGETSSGGAAGAGGMEPGVPTPCRTKFSGSAVSGGQMVGGGGGLMVHKPNVTTSDWSPSNTSLHLPRAKV